MSTTIFKTITTVNDADASSSSVETVVQTIENVTESTPVIETIKSEIVTDTRFFYFFSCFGCGPKPTDIAKEVVDVAQEQVEEVIQKSEFVQESNFTIVETVQEVQETVEEVAVVSSILSTTITDEPTGTDDTTETIESVFVETVSKPEVVRNSSSEELKSQMKRNSVSSVKNVTNRVSTTFRGIGGRLKTIGRPKSVVILENEVSVLSESESPITAKWYFLNNGNNNIKP
ncbi:hypothetical protein HK096_009476 [Nowakowskiella sp. JEL0078]|nr:hypothetical protein HK096_009476 [Nowakowskiella sp. JEL0078]